MRIILCFAAILIAVLTIAGCKKDTSANPVKAHQTIKLAPIDSTGINGGGQGPKNPHN